MGICLASGEIVRLMPGINEIEEEILKVIKNYPLFQSRVNKGLVQIMHENIGKDGKRTLEEMLSYIPKIFDTKLLKKIIETDGRDKVTKAASDQLDKIKNPARRDENQDEHFK